MSIEPPSTDLEENQQEERLKEGQCRDPQGRQRRKMVHPLGKGDLQTQPEQF